METIVGSLEEQIGCTRQGTYEQRRASGVEDSICHRHFGWKNTTCLNCISSLFRDEDHRHNALGIFKPHGSDMLTYSIALCPGDRKATQHARGNIIWMTLSLGGQ